MKFLVTTNEGPEFHSDQEALEALEAVVLPGLDRLQELEAAGTIAGGLPLGGRCLAFILEAGSHDEADKILRHLPMWGVLEWQVTALQSFQGRADMERGVAARIKSAG